MSSTPQNPQKTSGHQVLAEVMKVNQSLRHINLLGCPVGSGAKAGRAGWELGMSLSPSGFQSDQKNHCC